MRNRVSIIRFYRASEALSTSMRVSLAHFKQSVEVHSPNVPFVQYECRLHIANCRLEFIVEMVECSLIIHIAQKILWEDGIIFKSDIF